MGFPARGQGVSQLVWWPVCLLGGNWTTTLPTYVLARSNDEWKGHKDHNGYRVVESEDGRVDVHRVYFEEALQPPENVQHGVVRGTGLVLWSHIPSGDDGGPQYTLMDTFTSPLPTHKESIPIEMRKRDQRLFFLAFFTPPQSPEPRNENSILANLNIFNITVFVSHAIDSHFHRDERHDNPDCRRHLHSKGVALLECSNDNEDRPYLRRITRQERARDHGPDWISQD